MSTPGDPQGGSDVWSNAKHEFKENNEKQAAAPPAGSERQAMERIKYNLQTIFVSISYKEKKKLYSLINYSTKKLRITLNYLLTIKCLCGSFFMQRWWKNVMS